MKSPAHVRAISRSLFSLLAYMACCMICLAGFAMKTLHSIEEEHKTHAESFVPAKRLTTDYEREILNARIFFIYFVTIQKPGSLEKGWERYHNGEARLKDIAALIDQHPELSNLSEPVKKLQLDMASYGVALSATLNMVKSGELKGDHYDAQVKEWAARGAVMVTDAGNVEKLTFKSSEANTIETSNALRGGQRIVLLILLASLLLCAVLTFRFVTKLKTLLDPSDDEVKLTGALPASA